MVLSRHGKLVKSEKKNLKIGSRGKQLRMLAVLIRTILKEQMHNVCCA